MRNYTANKYKDLVEDIDDEYLQRFMADEKKFLAGISEMGKRTTVDLGAGYGRVVPYLSGISHNVVAIEINPDMFPELNRRSTEVQNVLAIEGDFLELESILPAELNDPVFLILQNSLGTIEGGDDYNDTLKAVVDVACKTSGEIILSLLHQSELATWGVSMYGKLKDMVGAVDKAKSDFHKGILVTDTGYTSKWWTDEDIDKFRDLGKVVREEKTDKYTFIQLKL